MRVAVARHRLDLGARGRRTIRFVLGASLGDEGIGFGLGRLAAQLDFPIDDARGRLGSRNGDDVRSRRSSHFDRRLIDIDDVVGRGSLQVELRPSASTAKDATAIVAAKAKTERGQAQEIGAEWRLSRICRSRPGQTEMAALKSGPATAASRRTASDSSCLRNCVRHFAQAIT